MTTEIWRDFDPNLDIPEELKNARYSTLPDVNPDKIDDDDLDPLLDGFSDDDDALGFSSVDEALDAPSNFTIIAQTVRTAPDGGQVIDVVLDVEDVDGAINYEVRVTPG